MHSTGRARAGNPSSDRSRNFSSDRRRPRARSGHRLPDRRESIDTPDEVIDLVLVMEDELLARSRVEVPAG
jgi:hypothetical protein